MQTPTPQPQSSKGCGCTSAPSYPPRAPQQSQSQESSREPPGILETQQRAALCFACPSNRGGSYCAKHRAPLLTLITAPDNACRNFPNEDGTTRLYSLTWRGVPLPVRQLVESEAKIQEKAPPLLSKFPGCGCLSLLKSASEYLATQGDSGALLSAKIDDIAQALSPYVAKLLALAIFAERKCFLYLERINVYKPTPEEIASRVDNGRYIRVTTSTPPKPEALKEIVLSAGREGRDVRQAILSESIERNRAITDYSHAVPA